jgi:hypothetical protein
MVVAQPVDGIQFEMQGMAATSLQQEFFLTENPLDPPLDAGHCKG